MQAPARVRTCAQRHEADYRACEVVSHGVDGMAYLLESANVRFRVRSPIPGRFTVENTLLASACALELGISPIAIQDALVRLSGIAGRMERLAAGGCPICGVHRLCPYP